jgi:small subunit ribosomal protein S6
MNRYELIYILDVSLEESVRKELIGKFSQVITDNGGEIEKMDEWGKRKLAYSIDYKTEGYYVLVNFKANPELPRELERNLEINENVIRYLVVKLLTKRSSVKPRPARPVFQTAAPAEEAAVPAADEAPSTAEIPAEPAVTAEAGEPAAETEDKPAELPADATEAETAGAPDTVSAEPAADVSVTQIPDAEPSAEPVGEAKEDAGSADTEPPAEPAE